MIKTLHVKDTHLFGNNIIEIGKIYHGFFKYGKVKEMTFNENNVHIKFELENKMIIIFHDYIYAVELM